MAPVTKIFSLFAILTVVLGAAKVLTPQNGLSQIIINDQMISVEVADTPEKIVRGLSGREKMAANQGMLFVFNSVGNYPFWMKDMRFDLDFLFINGDAIVDLAENIPFPTAGQDPQTVIAAAPFDKVLEINAGQIKKLGLKVNDKISRQ